jgi:four helix bundle protein
LGIADCGLAIGDWRLAIGDWRLAIGDWKKGGNFSGDFRLSYYHFRMNELELKGRTKQFALDIINYCEELPKTETCKVLGRQLLRSGTSVGANYRAACRSRSSADFVSKMGVVEEEADESGYWMELLVAHRNSLKDKSTRLIQEANELTAIAVASINTARKGTRGS